MTEQDVRAFTHDVMGALYENYNEKPNPRRTAIYFAALRDLSFPEVLKASEDAIKTLKFFPKPAELLELVRGDVEERGIKAWSRVLNAAIKGYGTYRPLDFGDAVIHATIIGMGGWARVFELGHRDSEGVDAAVMRKHFLQLHTIHARRGVPAETPPAVAIDQARVGKLPPMTINELGMAPEAEAQAVKALPASSEPAEYVGPTPEFLKLRDELARKLAVPAAVRDAPVEREYTPAEIAQQERDKQEKLQDLRERGAIPAKES